MVRTSSTRSEAALRGRPRREEAEQRRRHLIETAMQLFLKDGLAVTMDRIAKTAGISKRTLYASYPDKLALFVAVLEWLSSEGTKEGFTLDPELPIVPALIQYGEALIDHYSTPHIVAFLRLMQREKEIVPDLERLMREEVVRDQIMPLVRYLEANRSSLLGGTALLIAARIHFRNVIGEIADVYSEGGVPDRIKSREFLELSSQILCAGLLHRDKG